MTEAALARRDDRLAVIETILGTGDIRLMIEQAKQNASVAIEIARQRGFVTDYDIKNKQGQVVGQRAFFHLPTWQLLAQSWGITAMTEGTPAEVKPGTWAAAAIAQVVEDGRMIGRAVAYCARSEPGKNYKGDHDLAATAQSRAQRNAIRSCLGSLLIAAGVDISDPDAPATTDQVGLLHQLERELGWTEEEGHARAGIDHYRNLTREQASEVLDEWSRLKEDASPPGEVSSDPPSSPGDDGSGGDAPSSGEGVAPRGAGRDPSPEDLPDPIWNFGVRSGQHFSQLANEAPEILREIVKTARSEERRRVAQGWLDRIQPPLTGSE